MTFLRPLLTWVPNLLECARPCATSQRLQYCVEVTWLNILQCLATQISDSSKVKLFGSISKPNDRPFVGLWVAKHAKASIVEHRRRTRSDPVGTCHFKQRTRVTAFHQSEPTGAASASILSLVIKEDNHDCRSGLEAHL
jgi:hypothetical protein